MAIFELLTQVFVSNFAKYQYTLGVFLFMFNVVSRYAKNSNIGPKNFSGCPPPLKSHFEP